jgi:predicted ATP-dependent serine protease
LPAKWDGACPNCGRLYRAEQVSVADGEGMIAPIREGEAASMADLIATLDDEDEARIATGLPGLDYVLGGGLPLSSCALLLAAPEGAGKSTLILELFRSLAQRKVATLYVNAEQSAKAFARQHKRLGAFSSERQLVAAESDASAIFDLLDRHRPQVACIDSLHTVEGVMDAMGVPFTTGGVSAVSQLGRDLKRYADDQSMTIFAIGHVNNDGQIAGGTHLRHMLDATLFLDRGADGADKRRILRTEGKSRIGESGRRALFRMTDDGLLDCGPLKAREVTTP